MSIYIPNTGGPGGSNQYVWDAGTLTWVPMTQPGGGGGGGDASAANQLTEISRLDDIIFYTSAAFSAPGTPAVVGGFGVQGLLGGYPLPIQAAAYPDWGSGQMTAVSGTASSSGNNTLVTPSGSNKIRLHYISYNPSAGVTAALRFAAGGSLFLKNTLTVGGGVVAKDLGDFRYLQGGAGEALILNLSGAVSTDWNLFYTEIF